MDWKDWPLLETVSLAYYKWQRESCYMYYSFFYYVHTTNNIRIASKDKRIALKIASTFY